MALTMTKEEREAFLADVHVAVISVAEDGHGPLVVPIWYSYELGGEVRIITGRTSRKGRLLERAGRFSLCVQAESPPYRYVSVEGPIVAVEAPDIERDGRPLKLPPFVAELIERVAFEAREDKRVDRRSGVSQRLPISVLENVVSSAERRTIATKEKTVVPRVSDIYAALPAITGKLELEYEGELQGPEVIAKDLIRRAAGKTFEARVGGANVDDIVHWFDEGGALKISSDERSETCLKGFSVVPGLLDLVDQVGLAAKKDPGTMVAACELVLEGLVAEKRISRSEELGYTRARAETKGPGYGKPGSGGPNLFS